MISGKFRFDWISGSRRKEKNFNIFLQSSMAAEPHDLSIILYHPSIPMSCGTCLWSFPSICPAILEIFEGFRVNPKWLPDHVTYDIIVFKLYSAWIVYHLCTVSLRSVKRFCRRFFYYFFEKTIWLPNHVMDDVIRFWIAVEQNQNKLKKLLNLSLFHTYILKWPGQYYWHLGEIVRNIL